MLSSFERRKNLLKVISEYESIVSSLQKTIASARKSQNLEQKYPVIIAMLDEATISRESLEILAEEKANLRVNSAKARYREKQKQKAKPLSLVDISQDLNDYNEADNI